MPNIIHAHSHIALEILMAGFWVDEGAFGVLLHR